MKLLKKIVECKLKSMQHITDIFSLTLTLRQALVIVSLPLVCLETEGGDGGEERQQA